MMTDDRESLAQLLAQGAGQDAVFKAVSQTMQNLDDNIRELLDAKDLNALGPMVARSDFLDYGIFPA